MGRKLKTKAIPKHLLMHLGSAKEYVDEGLAIAKKVALLIDKKPSELTEEEKQVLKRSSEIVILLETTMCIEGIK